MDIFVYSDESGTFDCLHSTLFVFGGIVFLSSEDMQSSSRRYQAVERQIRNLRSIPETLELKAHDLLPEDSRRLFRATTREFRFGVVVEIPRLRIRERIANDKKARQRYMDYVYKIAVKRFLSTLIRDGAIDPEQVRVINFFADQHTTATNGRYELCECLEQELIHGTINFEYQTSYPPLFPHAKAVTLKFCDSKTVALIRAADIVANRIFRLARKERLRYEADPHLYVIRQP